MSTKSTKRDKSAAMTGNPPVNIPPTRVSARIEARQTQHTPSWVTPSTTNGEKRLLQALLDHLHDSADSLAVLQYLTKEFRPIAATLHTIPTIRKVRSRLLELDIAFIRYDRTQNKWQYWNGFTETGMLAWAGEGTTTTRVHTSTMRDTSGEPVSEHARGSSSATLDEETENEEEKEDKSAQKSPDPLGTSNKQQTMDPPADRDPPAASSSPDISTQTQMEAYSTLSQLTTQTQSPALLTTPARRAPAPSEWFQSPQKIRNPYTGRMVQAPTPPRLQAMIQDLQNHEDWFEEPDDASLVLQQQDDQTPSTRTATQHAGRGTSPQVDGDGFIEVLPPHGGHQRTTPRTAHTSTATQVQNRYQVLMEEAMETLTEHAQGLETTATERHQARMDKTQTEIQSAVAAAIDTIQQAAETQCATQKETLSRYCNEQVESLIADLDNFSGQAHQIQQEILNGVRDGTNEARTVPIEDEEVIEEVIPPPESRRTKRFPQVDYQAIMSGRNPPSPLPDKAAAPSEVPEEK